MSDFRGTVRAFLSFHRSNTYCYVSAPFSLSSVRSFISFFNCTRRSCRLWCMYSWSWQSCPGNVWFTDPLLTYWFDLPFTFQRPGTLTAQGAIVVRLSMFDHGGKPLKICSTDWNTEWMWHTMHKAPSKIVVSNRTCTLPTPAHTMCYKVFCTISPAQMLFHTLHRFMETIISLLLS